MSDVERKRRESFRKLWTFVRPFRRKLFAAVGLAVVINLISQLPPWISRFFIDRVITGGAWQFLAAVVVVQTAIPLISYLMSFWDNYLIAYAGQKLVLNIRRKLFGHILHLPLREFDEMGTGKFISRLMRDTATVQNMVTWNTVSIVNNFISFLIGIVVIFYFSWKLSLVALFILPLHWVNYRFFVKRMRYKTRLVRRKWDQIYDQLYERIWGTKLVRTYTREEEETRHFTSSTVQALGLTMENTALGATFGGFSTLIDGLGNTLVFVTGCYFVLKGELTYGTVAAFMMYVWRVLNPVLQFSSIANMVEQTLVSVERISEVLDIEEEPKKGIELPPLRGHVRFEDVWFEYVPGEPVLKGINLEVKPGMKVALVGPTGCGKTTLTSLLLRFYEPTKGCILVDGYDITKVDLRSLRRQMGQVLQDSVLFNSLTIKENIAYGIPNASEKQVVKAAKIAKIHDLILSKPGGYEAEIGGEGVVLSLGEKQRLCIARVVAADPAILALDEATSALDTQSEALIQKALESVMKGRTSFIIAHRLSTIVGADLIVVMEKGRIVEMGTHRDLLAKEDGFYRKLYEQQFLIQEQDKARWAA
ncbi:MAG TPA: ABC transporter ATP-binding protein [Candidatus Latescibacteria bacterium]|nr:ABC transporter ATP-binding protein [Candidatus Latescibacterota bacterium]